MQGHISLSETCMSTLSELKIFPNCKELEPSARLKDGIQRTETRGRFHERGNQIPGLSWQCLYTQFKPKKLT